MPATDLHWSLLGDTVQSLLQASLGPTARVYNGIRWTNDSTEFDALFRDTEDELINAWFITREKVGTVRGGTKEGQSLSLPLGHMLRNHSIRIDGVVPYSGDGTSEARFQELLDMVFDTFGENVTLLCGSLYTYGPEVLAMGLDLFGETVCHTVSIQMVASVRSPVSFQ